jgi:hypothetical protein
MTKTDPTCVGNCNGTATATASGGQSPYTYAWSNGGTTQTINGLCAGNYTVTVTDANQCPGVASVTLGPGVSITVTTNVTHTTCGLSNGSATATPSGGSGYTYLWSNGGTTQTITGLASGSYTVTVTATGGCTATATAVVNTSSGISATATAVHTTCGLSNGSVTANPSGGSGYTYLWMPGNHTTQTVNNLSSGTYNVTVTSSNGCTATASATIAGSTGINATTMVVHESCNDCNDGTATVTPTGGSDYTYLWSNGQTTQTIIDLAPGTYTVTVTAIGGCTAIASAVVNTFGCPTITLATSVTNALCYGENGSATVTPSGGASPYSYLWNTNDTTATISAPAGNYSVIVTDSLGCANSTALTITQPSILTATTSAMAEICHEACDGEASVIYFGGVEPYSLLWNNGDTLNDLIGLCPGEYSVTLTDTNGCSTLDSITVMAGLLLMPELEDLFLCYGEEGLLTVGGDIFETYLWNTGETTNSILVSADDTYSVSVTKDGCSATAEAEVDINSELMLEISRLSDTLTAIINGGTKPYLYLWSNGDTTDQIVPTEYGEYTVTIIDSIGCSIIDTIEFTVSTTNISKLSVKIYPNPVNSIIYLDLPTAVTEGDISLYDLHGKRVLRAPITSSEIDVNGFISGTYLLRILTNDAVFMTKVIKN